MEKLYNRIDWHNNTSPAINETNLNRMSKAVDDIDDRVVGIAGTVMETVPQIQEDLAETQELLEDAEELTTHPPIIGQNGHWWTWDTSIDDYADSGVDAGVSLTIGETTTLPAGSDAKVTNTGTATDPVLNFGIPQGETGQAGAGVPTGGTTGQVLKKKSGTNYDTEWEDIKQDGITGTTVNRFGECTTQASVNDKYVSITWGTFSLEAGAKVTVKFRYTNTATSPRLKVGNTLAQDIYYRGVQVGPVAPAGVLNGVIDFVYDGSYYNIVGTFVNTTYESKAAVSGGTALSLVTTGEKYIWNNPPSSGHTILNGSGSAMNQRSKLQFDGLNVTDDSGNDKTVVTAPTPDYVDEQFNSTTTYSKGMTCISGNKRYRYINSTASSGHQPPNATYWEVLSVSDELQWINRWAVTFDKSSDTFTHDTTNNRYKCEKRFGSNDVILDHDEFMVVMIRSDKVALCSDEYRYSSIKDNTGLAYVMSTALSPISGSLSYIMNQLEIKGTAGQQLVATLSVGDGFWSAFSTLKIIVRTKGGN